MINKIYSMILIKIDINTKSYFFNHILLEKYFLNKTVIKFSNIYKIINLYKFI